MVESKCSVQTLTLSNYDQGNTLGTGIFFN